MELAVPTAQRTDLVDVTSMVEEAVPADVRTGSCTVFVPHTTAGVVVNEAEPGLIDDVATFLDRTVPWGDGYRHDEIDDNAAAHMRATLIGESVTVPIEGGSLRLGTWQSILFVECDGPRERRLHVVVSEA